MSWATWFAGEMQGKHIEPESVASAVVGALLGTAVASVLGIGYPQTLSETDTNVGVHVSFERLEP